MALTQQNTHPGPRGLGAAAIAASVLVLPATVLLGSSVMRRMQPPDREPAHTFAIIDNWGLGHATRLSASVLLIAMPLAALAIGVATLRRRWRADEQLRTDAHVLLALARRQALT